MHSYSSAPVPVSLTLFTQICFIALFLPVRLCLQAPPGEASPSSPSEVLAPTSQAHSVPHLGILLLVCIICLFVNSASLECKLLDSRFCLSHSALTLSLSVSLSLPQHPEKNLVLSGHTKNIWCISQQILNVKNSSALQYHSFATRWPSFQSSALLTLIRRNWMNTSSCALGDSEDCENPVPQCCQGLEDESRWECRGGGGVVRGGSHVRL